MTFQEAPRPVGKRSHFAFEVQFLTTEKVLRRKHDIDGAIAGNAETIGQNLGGCKGPARATIQLVANGMDASAALLSRIERCGEEIALMARSSAPLRQRRIAGAQSLQSIGRTGPCARAAHNTKQSKQERGMAHISVGERDVCAWRN